MATVFDTLAFSRRLQQASFTPAQSDALAVAVHEAVRGGVATKNDLEAQGVVMRKELADASSAIRLELADTRSELKLEMQGLRAELLVMKRMTGAIVAGVLALVAKTFF